MLRKPKDTNCFCAFCRSPRRVELRRHISALTAGLAALFSVSFSVAMWTSLDARALLIFILILGLAEFLIQIRWRLGVVCQACGFDPVLYLRDSAAAADKVIGHIERRHSSPLGTMRKLNLPVRARESQKVAGQIRPITGKNLSKQV